MSFSRMNLHTVFEQITRTAAVIELYRVDLKHWQKQWAFLVGQQCTFPSLLRIV